MPINYVSDKDQLFFVHVGIGIGVLVLIAFMLLFVAIVCIYIYPSQSEIWMSITANWRRKQIII